MSETLVIPASYAVDPSNRKSSMPCCTSTQQTMPPCIVLIKFRHMPSWISISEQVGVSHRQ